MRKDLKRRAIHWTRLFGHELYPDVDRKTHFARMDSSFLACAAEHGLTLYIFSKLQAMRRNTGSLAGVPLLLLHAMSARTAKECQLNPDLIEVLLNRGEDPLRWSSMDPELESMRPYSAWAMLLNHDAGMDPLDFRWDRWKKITTMFVTHLHSPKQISEVENLLGQAELMSPLSISFVQQQLEERAKQLATTENPLPSRSRGLPEQPIRGSKRQKKN